MFITEQHIKTSIYKKARKGLFKAGMPLVNPKHVSQRFTYKEFTLVIGVLVALIIALTLWMKRLNGSEGIEKPEPVAELTIIPVKEILQKSVMQIRFYCFRGATFKSK